jgi:hypothetical protein
MNELVDLGRRAVVVGAVLSWLHGIHLGCCVFVSVRSLGALWLPSSGLVWRLPASLRQGSVSITVPVCLETEELVLDGFHVSSPWLLFVVVRWRWASRRAR